ncbi:LOW QUALITY PROTEIN: tyrosine-protein kinase FRK [Microcaecilia unicolor]|uniref:Tyrosine-protein kinase n=1 Tax=Microcaecilia unicolor TaxID=1415580 RepID=A0A6P7XX88_9AMPH|nr:LOW QUALITY PROTEIN: tyrosine-protein kinase FRK [Microcaecilia unicolor]
MGNYCQKHCGTLQPYVPCCYPSTSEDKRTSYIADSIVISNPMVQPPVNLQPSQPVARAPAQRASLSSKFYVALYDYQARTTEDLSFKAGELLEVINGEDTQHSGWWHARALGSAHRKEGYIPSNFVAPFKSIEAEPWFFRDLKRMDAEKQLLYPGVEAGAFLIRDSETQRGDYSLSVFDGTSVKHYRIKRLDTGEYFVARKKTFLDVTALVEYYKRYQDGLCVRLGQPCEKKEVPEPFGLSYKTQDEWEIDRNSLRLLKKLGSGQFGDVWEGMWNNTTPVAIKTLKPGSMERKDFLREAQIMKKLRHPKLIQLYAVCSLEDPIYIITELMRHGSLQQYLQNDGGESIKVQQQVDMAAQVAAGMAYLESQNYVHRDLAARNVLVGEHNVYKVADFGLTRILKVENENAYEPVADKKLPIKWTAPEALQFNKFSVKSDIWSFGVLLYEIVTYGKMPYVGLTGAQVLQKLEKGYRMPRPPNCPLELYQIMLDCWKKSPEERPTFETLRWQFDDFFEQNESYFDSNTFVG